MYVCMYVCMYEKFMSVCLYESVYIYIYIYIYVCVCVCVCVCVYIQIPDIGLGFRVFANGPGDLGSIPGRVIPKDSKKWYLMPPCLTLSIIRYGSRVK